MHAEVIAIGDELTSGERLDTNSQWLSQQLADLGIEVRFHTTVGDDLEANREVFRSAIDRAEFVVTTGGLGPTADDLTREALAAAVGAELVRDEAALAHIRQLFVSRGREMPERNARQAEFPAGATSIFNPNGTAPGVQMLVERVGRPPCQLFALPGVPAEMHEMWRATVGPTISAALPAPRVIRHRRLKCFGVGESHLEAMLPDMIRRGHEPRVGITVSAATITLRATASGSTEAEALATIEPALATMREKLGVLVFGEEDDELEHTVARQLAAAGQTVATAESWSAGLLAHWLAGAGVLAESRVSGAGSVGEAAVMELARQVRAQSASDYGLAIGAPDETDPPRVAIALALDAGGAAKSFPLVGHPTIIKPRIAKLALNMLRLHLLNANEAT